MTTTTTTATSHDAANVMPLKRFKRKVIILSLEKSPTLFEKLTPYADCYIFKGITGDEVPSSARTRYFTIFSSLMRASTMGIAYSHVRIWEDLVRDEDIKSDNDGYLVFEDDAIIERAGGDYDVASFLDYVEDSINAIVESKHSIEMFTAGYSSITGVTIPANIAKDPNIVKLNSFYGTHCYYISQFGAAKLLNATVQDKINDHIDRYITKLVKTKRFEILAPAQESRLVFQTSTDPMVQLGYPLTALLAPSTKDSITKDTHADCDVTSQVTSCGCTRDNTIMYPIILLFPASFIKVDKHFNLAYILLTSTYEICGYGFNLVSLFWLVFGYGLSFLLDCWLSVLLLFFVIVLIDITFNPRFDVVKAMFPRLYVDMFIFTGAFAVGQFISRYINA